MGKATLATAEASSRYGFRQAMVGRGPPGECSSSSGRVRPARGGSAMAAKNSKESRAADGTGDRPRRLPRKIYEKELFRLQAELVRLQEWARSEGARVVVVFEGRDAAGKGSTIKR